MRLFGLIVAGALASSTLVVAAEARTERSPYVWCAGETFPFAGLKNPTGAEDADTEPAAVLSAYLETRLGRRLPQSGWRLVFEDASKVLFARWRPFGHERPPIVAGVRVIRGDDGLWRFDGAAWCLELRRARRDLRASPWRVRPGTRLSGRTRVLHLLVREQDCASGMSAEGRIGRPLVLYRRRSVKVAVFIRPVTGVATCQGNPETPYTLRLGSPLGKRRLLDAGTIPASRRHGPPRRPAGRSSP